MDLMNAIVEVAISVQPHVAIAQADVQEPACNPGFIEAILNAPFVQSVWGYTKSVPVLLKYILVPVFLVIVGVFIFGMRRAGNSALKWLLTVVMLALAAIILPAILAGNNWFGSC